MYSPHAYANLFPMMMQSEFDALVDDIRMNGLKQPIILYENQVLDGRNRYKACLALGIDPTTVHYDGCDPLGDVISWNLHRRHLSESQRGLVAARIANIKRGGIRSGQNTVASQTANLQGEVSRQSASKLLNVSERTIATAKKVEQYAAPELLVAVETGQLTVNTASYLATLPIAEQQKIIAGGIQAVQSAAKELKEALLLSRTERIHHNEWYTASEYIEAARGLFGQIDLDPASCELANKTVKAKQFFTREDDGLLQDWHGRCFVNPPYSQPDLSKFVAKLIAEFSAGKVTEAILLVHNYTDSRWFHDALTVASAVLFTKGRIGFINPEGVRAAALQGQVLVYFGKRPNAFKKAFEQFGTTLYTEQF